MPGLGPPLSGTHTVTQPFAGTYYREKPGYLQRTAGQPYRIRKSSFVGGTYGAHLHGGVDIGCAIGTPVIAPEKGKIVANVIDATSGDHYVLLQVRPGTLLEFSHLSKVLLPVGTIVPRGRQFALSGATGHVSGPHLHWMVLHAAATASIWGWYGWFRYNPKRLSVGGDLAGTDWIKPL